MFQIDRHNTQLPVDTWTFDSEVTAFDWLFVFKKFATGEYFVVANDNESLAEFMRFEQPLLVGFNNKHYDQFVLKGCLLNYFPEQIKEINDYIIGGGQGWYCPLLINSNMRIRQFDLMDDTQTGTSLKGFEAHIGMNIVESSVSFDVDHPLSDEEMEEMIRYCKHDVDATERLLVERMAYLENKIALGKECGLSVEKSLYMTNAKLTSTYLGAKAKDHTDEREYKYPDNLLRKYIPQEVFDYFDRMHDPRISDETLYGTKLEIMVGECPVTLGFGGIHGAIPNYKEEATETRKIRNKDVASYYPHLMTLDGYCSRNMPDPKRYADTIERRVKAKKAGDKVTANALKLVLNTTYGAMLNGSDGIAYNDLYDPLMGRSVCITGQLRLLELANHVLAECPTAKIVQLNTDGIMVSLDDTDEAKWQEVTSEWEHRTGYELEEDFIKRIFQKDVNNYVEVAENGDLKVKGGMLVRGMSTAGAFKINNDARIIAKALEQNLAYDIPVADTINACDDITQYQIVARASSKYSHSYHEVDGVSREVQKVNRVYASKDEKLGGLTKKHKQTGVISKIPSLPDHCIIDNDNHLTIEAVDKSWYIKEAQKKVNAFYGVKAPGKRITNKAMKDLDEILGGLN